MLLNIIVAFVAVGFLVWLINTVIPMAPDIRKAFNIVVTLILVLWALRVMGVFDLLSHATTGIRP